MTVKVRDSKTVTEEKAYWLLPAGGSGATYREVRDIDFTSAKTKKKLLDTSISACSSPPRTASVKARVVNQHTSCARVVEFYVTSAWSIATLECKACSESDLVRRVSVDTVTENVLTEERL